MTRTEAAWDELVSRPSAGDHVVHFCQDEAFLVEAVARYAAAALRGDGAALVIATAEHRERILRELEREGPPPGPALRLLDAEETLARFMAGGKPQWREFRETIGSLVAEMRAQYPAVRAYGEMVDLLWQRGEREAAIRLEEYWCELAKLQSFSLLCAYRIDALDARAYGEALEAVCRSHTHVIPARDYARFNEAVRLAAKEVLDEPLAQMLLSLSTRHQPAAGMPLGQATLLWLGQNMPRTAEKVLAGVRARLALA
jgi:hypothetical protein